MSNAKRIFSGSTDLGEVISIATTKRPVAIHNDGITSLQLYALVANVDAGELEILSLHNNFFGAANKKWAFKENSRITNAEIVLLTAKEGA